MPLSGVTKYCPVFVRMTTERRAVPTPGSTIDTNTVPAGQKGATCRSRYAAVRMSYGGICCVRSTTWRVGLTV